MDLQKLLRIVICHNAVGMMTSSLLAVLLLVFIVVSDLQGHTGMIMPNSILQQSVNER